MIATMPTVVQAAWKPSRNDVPAICWMVPASAGSPTCPDTANAAPTDSPAADTAGAGSPSGVSSSSTRGA